MSLAERPPVYLDNAATTPLDPVVLAAMTSFWRAVHGNASALHGAGVRAAAAVERARRVIAARLGAALDDDLVFTSGGTESNNLAILGVAEAHGEGHLVTTRVEHSSVLRPFRHLEARGFQVTWLDVDGTGRVDPAAVVGALRSDTILVSIGHGNNEVGTIQPIAEIGALCRAAGVPLHVDACQSFTRAPLDVRADLLDLVTINAHKLHGPTGVGALFVRRGIGLEPLLLGGPQESGLRPGTLNAAAVVGFGEACRIAPQVDATRARLDSLRDRLLAAIPEAWVNGAGAARLCHILSLTLPGRDARRLAQRLNRRGVMVSTGSACTSAQDTPSHVLLALGLSPAQARATLRISGSRMTTDEDVDRALLTLLDVLRQEDPSDA